MIDGVGKLDRRMRSWSRCSRSIGQIPSVNFGCLGLSLSPFLRQEFSLERSFRDNGVTKFIRNYFIRGGILFFENIFQVIKKVCC